MYGITFIKGQDYELDEVKSNKNIKNNVGNKIIKFDSNNHLQSFL